MADAIDSLVEKETARISKFPETGRITEFENVRSIVIKDYLLFYEETDVRILIVCFWDGRQDPEKLKTRLE